MPGTEPAARKPTRRDALRLTMAALAPGVTVPARACASTDARPESDAERIALCAVIVDKEAARQALCATRHTLADEQRTEPALQALYAKGGQAMDRLMDLPGPFTIEALHAMARASLAIAPRDWDGVILSQGDAEWLAFSVVEHLVEAPTT